MVVRAGRILTGCDDGEVDDIVALRQQPGRDVGRDGGFGAADERDLAGVELGCDEVGRGAGPCESIDLRRVLHRTQRRGDARRLRPARVRQQRLEVDEEGRPAAVADGKVRAATHKLGDHRRG